MDRERQGGRLQPDSCCVRVQQPPDEVMDALCWRGRQTWETAVMVYEQPDNSVDTATASSRPPDDMALAYSASEVISPHARRRRSVIDPATDDLDGRGS